MRCDVENPLRRVNAMVYDGSKRQYNGNEKKTFQQAPVPANPSRPSNTNRSCGEQRGYVCVGNVYEGTAVMGAKWNRKRVCIVAKCDGSLKGKGKNECGSDAV